MQIENPWRKAHEASAVVAWSVAGITGLVIAPFANVPAMPVLVAAIMSFGFAASRAKSVYTIWEAQARLRGRAVEWVDPDDLVKELKKHPAHMRLGDGFDWNPVHVQRLYDLKRQNPDTIAPPAWYLRLRHRWWAPHKTGKDERGEEWIHGLEPNELPVTVPFADLEGHTCIYGTTGSGKTRLFEIISTQLIHKGPKTVLVCLDPKGDIQWRERIQRECVRAGKEFMFFHPAHPQQSVRLDPMKNWNRATELASRVASLIKGDSGDSVFKEFAWRAINQITEAMIDTGQRPNLLSIRRALEGGPENLLQQVLERYFQEHVPDWESRIDPYVKKANRGDFTKEQKGKGSSNELMAWVRFYKAEIPEGQRKSSVDGLISMFEHNRDHQMKLIQSVLPLLTQLTSGDLGALLSPEAGDPDDIRPILDTRKIIETGQVLYVGLDALSDSSVASAIGAIILADLASVAGNRYNYGGDPDIEIFLMVDEATECMTPPFVSLLNKGRGSGFRVIFATQSFPDFVARTGNKPLAQMLVANANNLIALRTIEEETQKYITANFGKTSIVSVSSSQSTSASTDGGAGHFSGGYSERLSQTEVEIFPPDMMGRLPNLHYMAHVSAGRIIKGRLSLLTRDHMPSPEDASWMQTP
jgi:conjugal transfer pilus assembly protein TraD